MVKREKAKWRGGVWRCGIRKQYQLQTIEQMCSYISKLYKIRVRSVRQSRIGSVEGLFSVWWKVCVFWYNAWDGNDDRMRQSKTEWCVGVGVRLAYHIYYLFERETKQYYRIAYSKIQNIRHVPNWPQPHPRKVFIDNTYTLLCWGWG